jgi:hypothetical protein
MSSIIVGSVSINLRYVTLCYVTIQQNTDSFSEFHSENEWVDVELEPKIKYIRKVFLRKGIMGCDTCDGELTYH